jgi:hypothetical protein
MKLERNQDRRREWIAGRREVNEKRKSRHLAELPESDVEVAVPKERPASKHRVIWHTYQYHAKSAALRAAMGEEKTKITALNSLGDTK